MISAMVPADIPFFSLFSMTVNVLYGVSFLTIALPEMPKNGPPPAKREGIIRISISVNMSIFSAHANLTVAIMIKTTPKEKTICLTPKLGMRTKTVKKVPKMLPAVEIEYRLPDIPPKVNMLSADKRIE